MAIDATSPWTIGGVVLTALASVVIAMKWLFSRQSSADSDTKHAQNLEQFALIRLSIAELRTPLATMDERLKSAERDIHSLREWKHLEGIPYVRAVDVLKARVDNLEKQRE